ncbi:AraC family transcriptional regulator [Paenibacillus solisilvae]|uniref:AraC family transcriptional regulator n=1 Tax=Paenibacillus solisilvae TaxID=2486751 RepID=A0ABW0W0A0_9BACL
MAIFNYNPERPFRDDIELYLSFWGKENCVPGHAVGPGVRDLYKVHFIHKGTGIVRVGDKQFNLSPGQAFFIYPHVVTYYEADRHDPWTYSWIGFQGTRVAPILSGTNLTPEQPVFPMDLRFMPALYDQLTELLTQEVSHDLQFTGILYEFFALLVALAPPSSPNAAPSIKKQDGYVHQSMEFIHAHYSENMSVQQLAAYLRLDRKYVSALFKDALGVPPQQYLLQYRMDKAAELLGKGLYTVGEVARSVGYQDALLFSKMFKKVKGISPKFLLPGSSYEDIVP